MGLISYIKKVLGLESVKVNGEGWVDNPLFIDYFAEACYRDLALWSCIDLISKSISKCEFKTYRNGEEVREDEWYRWNIEPNKNQNSSEFLRKLVATLYYKGECLVIEQGTQLFVADSFVRTPYTLYPDIFSGVVVGDIQFNRTFPGTEVLYWNLDMLGIGKNIRGIIQAVTESYTKLLTYTKEAYMRSRDEKATLDVSTVTPPPGVEDQLKWMQDQQKAFAEFLRARGGVKIVGNGLKLEPFGGKTTYSNENTRDIRHMIDDISDFTAKAFGIPPALLRGDVQGVSDALDQYLTFCIDPLADMLREEIVRKVFGRAGMQKGQDLIIDTKQIRHVDVLSFASNIDKLIGSGVYSVNGILKLIGEQPINEDWANKHMITKNYANIEDVQSLEGGESK